MRDAAGEGAERFELLGMEQLALEFGFPLLGRPLFGHVPDRPNAPDGIAFIIEHQIDFDKERFERPVRAANVEL